MILFAFPCANTTLHCSRNVFCYFAPCAKTRIISDDPLCTPLCKYNPAWLSQCVLLFCSMCENKFSPFCKITNPATFIAGFVLVVTSKVHSSNFLKEDIEIIISKSYHIKDARSKDDKKKYHKKNKGLML